MTSRVLSFAVGYVLAEATVGRRFGGAGSRAP